MITLRQLINNMSKGQSAISVRYILQGLDSVYQSLAPGIQILGAKKSGNKSTIFLSIPSEKDLNKRYFVAVELDTIEKFTLDTKLKVFTNSPGFLFNFAYVFHQSNALLYPGKIPSEFLTMPPKTRNPYAVAGFNKQIYAAIKYIGHSNLASILETYDGQPLPTVPTVRFQVNRANGKTELV